MNCTELLVKGKKKNTYCSKVIFQDSYCRTHWLQNSLKPPIIHLQFEDTPVVKDDIVYSKFGAVRKIKNFSILKPLWIKYTENT